MLDYFATTAPKNFHMFSASHITALVIILGICASFFVFAPFYRRERTGGLAGGRLGRIFMTVLIVQQLSYYVWCAWAGMFDAANVLPLQLCGASIYLCIFLWITDSRLIFEIVYFWGMCGTFMALFTPSMGGYDFPHYRFLQFFIGHGLIVITIMYYVAVRGWRVDIRSFFKSLAALHVLAVIDLIVNRIVGSNYMFLSAKPDSTSLMDILPDWPAYLLWMEVLAIVFMLLMLAPFSIARRLSRHRR